MGKTCAPVEKSSWKNMICTWSLGSIPREKLVPVFHDLDVYSVCQGLYQHLCMLYEWNPKGHWACCENSILLNLMVTHLHSVIHDWSILYLAHPHGIVKDETVLMAPSLTFQPNDRFDICCTCSLLHFCNTKSVMHMSMTFVFPKLAF